MPELLLESVEASAAVEEVGRIAMPEQVSIDAAPEASSPCRVLDDLDPAAAHRA